MKRIAVTTENGEIYQHFGKTQCFTLYTIEDGKVADKKLLDTSDSGHSALAGVLKQAGAELLICGGIGQGAGTLSAKRVSSSSPAPPAA